jgi:hypothetical protein
MSAAPGFQLRDGAISLWQHLRDVSEYATARRRALSDPEAGGAAPSLSAAEVYWSSMGRGEDEPIARDPDWGAERAEALRTERREPARLVWRARRTTTSTSPTSCWTRVAGCSPGRFRDEETGEWRVQLGFVGRADDPETGDSMRGPRGQRDVLLEFRLDRGRIATGFQLPDRVARVERQLREGKRRDPIWLS